MPYLNTQSVPRSNALCFRYKKESLNLLALELDI